MKRLVILMVVASSFVCSYGQTTFGPGYYVNNNDQKISGLIKDMDWKNNPTSIEFKTSENESPQTITIDDMKEFVILNSSKYVRKLVDIDRSSDEISLMTDDRNPVFNAERLMLKVLMESKASLFQFEEGNLIRFFYSKDNGDIKQLVFKSYLTPDSKVAKNVTYKQQIWSDLQCKSVLKPVVENLEYKKNDIQKIFTTYNKCSNAEITTYEKKIKRDLFNLTIRPGLNLSGLYIDNANNANFRHVRFANQLAFRVGLEAEFILPYNNNKWSVLIEPTLQQFTGTTSHNSVTIKADYQSVEVPLGLRHYFYFSDQSRLFVNAVFVYDFSRNSFFRFSNGGLFDIKAGHNFGIGAGYKQGKHLSAELRYQGRRNLLNEYISWNSNYNTLSLIMGWTLF